MLAILFGLSMDYRVFLWTRIREEYARTGDNAESVARGLAATGRVITSAALIMIAVFVSFVAHARRHDDFPRTGQAGILVSTSSADQLAPR